MPKEPKRRKGRVPEREGRVYILVNGEFEGNQTIDLVFYLNRLEDSLLPVVTRHEEVERVLDENENEVETIMLRLRSLSPEAMRQVIQTIIQDKLPRGVHPHYYR